MYSVDFIHVPQAVAELLQQQFSVPRFPRTLCGQWQSHLSAPQQFTRKDELT